MISSQLKYAFLSIVHSPDFFFICHSLMPNINLSDIDATIFQIMFPLMIKIMITYSLSGH